jgi:hypothetical protein|tara:strand:- start:203 stop:781 length:579 start_codon:yes stop_codon:yes gene_type:complete
MTINEKLATIQTQFKSKKSRFNSFGKYYFRSAEDILEATKPYLLELGVSVTINERVVELDSSFPMLESRATISDGENSIYSTAVVGVDLDQKGMQMPQKFGSASSYGKKYALGNLFLIDDTQDSDATNDHKSEIKKPKAKTTTDNKVFDKALHYIREGKNSPDRQVRLEAVKDKYGNQISSIELAKLNVAVK